MSGLVTHFLSLNLNPLQGLWLPSQQIHPGAGGGGWAWGGGDHLAGEQHSANQGCKTRAVPTALGWDTAWELGVSWCVPLFAGICLEQKGSGEPQGAALRSLCQPELGVLQQSGKWLYSAGVCTTLVCTCLLQRFVCCCSCFPQEGSLLCCVLTAVMCDNSKPSCQHLGRSWLLMDASSSWAATASTC